MTTTTSATVRRSALREFLSSESAGGIVLLAAAAAALVAANLPATAEGYRRLLGATVGPDLGHGPMTVLLWINDALMAVFFLLVGLEIKREVVDGGLARPQHRRLPVIAAASGMAVPALVYLAVAGHLPALRAGWAIPAATDIAFAIGIMALLGPRVPASLKLLLTTIAIVDDMGAVAIIAVGYTAHLDWAALAAAAGLVAAMAALNRAGVRRLSLYLPLAALLWWAVFASGIHATIAGVATAFAIPVVPTPGAPDSPESPLHRLEHALQPWVAFAIVPLFAFANAGVSLAGVGPSALAAPLPLGIALGLAIGKQVGIGGAIALAIRLGWAERPAGASATQLWGMALLAGIGFTMSLFIGGLAFPGDPLLVAEVKIGVLLGSAVSALAGFVVLRSARSG